MKHFYIFLLAFGSSLLVPASLRAADSVADSTQTWRQNWRHTFYINLNYTGGVLKMQSDKGLLAKQDKKGRFKTEGGGGLSFGRTFLIGRPIKNVLRFGIQATFLDFNYSRFSSSFDSLGVDDYHVRYNKTDIAVGVGPALIWQPVPHLRVRAYVQGFPALTILTSKEHLDGQNDTDDKSTQHLTLQGILTAGANLSYRFIGVGFEGRFCTVDGASFVTFSATEGSNPGWRAYLNFNF